MTRDEIFTQWANEQNIYPGARHIYLEAFYAGYDRGWFGGYGEKTGPALNVPDNSETLSLTLDKAY